MALLVAACVSSWSYIQPGEQSSDEAVISLDDIHHHARTLEDKVARRNRREYIAAVIALVWWRSYMGFAATAIVRVAAFWSSSLRWSWSTSFMRVAA